MRTSASWSCDGSVTTRTGTVKSTKPVIDIIANNPIDQKVVELSSSQHYSLGETSIYRSVFLPQGGEAGVFLPSSPSASEASACHDWSDSHRISSIALPFPVCLGAVCATTLC